MSHGQAMAGFTHAQDCGAWMGKARSKRQAQDVAVRYCRNSTKRGFMNEQSELSEKELAKTIEEVLDESVRLKRNFPDDWEDRFTKEELDILFTAAKRSQDLQKKLDEANARSEMWAKSAGGFAGERDALEQSSREKDELIEKLVKALEMEEMQHPFMFIAMNKALSLAQSKGYGKQKEK